MVEDLNEARLRKNGQVSPRLLTEDLNEWIEREDIETLILVVKDKDGEIITAFSKAENVEYVGMLEIAKLEIIESTF